MSLDTIYDAVLNGNAKAATAGVEAALQAGETPQMILNEACIPPWPRSAPCSKRARSSCPSADLSPGDGRGHDHPAAAAVEAGVKTVGKVVLGTVHGDLHDIGKNLVGMMLEGAGFEVVDLGTDVQPQQFVDAVKQHHPDIVGMSALLTTTTKSMPMTITALTEAGLRDKIKIFVGGAPITDEFAKKIGADGFAADAGSAAREPER